MINPLDFTDPPKKKTTTVKPQSTDIVGDLAASVKGTQNWKETGRGNTQVSTKRAYDISMTPGGSIQGAMELSQKDTEIELEKAYQDHQAELLAKAREEKLEADKLHATKLTEDARVFNVQAKKLEEEKRNASKEDLLKIESKQEQLIADQKAKTKAVAEDNSYLKDANNFLKKSDDVLNTAITGKKKAMVMDMTQVYANSALDWYDKMVDAAALLGPTGNLDAGKGASVVNKVGIGLVKEAANLLVESGRGLQQSFNRLFTEGKEEKYLGKKGAEQYKKYKEDLQAVATPAAYELKTKGKKQIARLDKILKEATPGSPTYNQASANKTKILRSMEVAEDILTGEAGFKPVHVFEELIGKNLLNTSILPGNVTGSYSDMALLESSRLAITDVLNNPATMYEDKYLTPYLQKRGKLSRKVSDKEAQEIWDSMDEADKLTLEAHQMTNEGNDLAKTGGSYWYNATRDTSSSVAMISSYFAGGLLSKGIKGGILAARGLKGASALAETTSAIRNTARISQAINAGARTEKGILATLKGAGKTADFALDVTTSTLVNPMFIAERMNRKGVGEMYDEEGRVTGMSAGSVYRDSSIKQLETLKKRYLEIIPVLEKKQDLTAEEAKILQKAKESLGLTPQLDEEGQIVPSQTLDEQILQLSETPESTWESVAKGWLTGAGEMLSERVGGKLVKGAIKYPALGTDWALKKVGGKPYLFVRDMAKNKVVNPLLTASRHYSDKLAYNTLLGRKYNATQKLVSSFSTLEGKQFFHSLPEEMMEEIPAELSGSIIDGDLNRFAESVTSVDFYKQIAAQTALLGGAMTGISSVNQTGLRGIQYRYEKAVQDQLSHINKLKALAASETDADAKKTHETGIKIAEETLAKYQSKRSALGEKASATTKAFRTKRDLDNLIFQLRTNKNSELSKEHRELLAHLDPNEKDVLESTERIKLLKEQGKFEEAHTVEMQSVSRFLDAAIQTDSLGELVASLENSLAKGKIGPQDIKTFENVSNLITTAKKVDTFLKENEGSDRARVGAKIIAQRDLIDHYINGQNVTISAAREEALKEVHDIWESKFSTSLTKEEATKIFEDFDISSIEESKKAVAETFLENLKKTTTNKFSTLGKVATQKSLIQTVKQQKADLQETFEEVMNPSKDVAFSERFNLAYQKARALRLNELKKDFLTQEEVNTLFEEVKEDQGRDFNRVSNQYKDILKNRSLALDYTLEANSVRMEKVLESIASAFQAQENEEIEEEEIEEEEEVVAPTPLVVTEIVDTPEEQIVINTIQGLDAVMAQQDSLMEFGDTIDLPEDFAYEITEEEAGQGLNPELLQEVTDAIKKIIGFYANATGSKTVFFTDVVKMIIAYENNPGNIIFSKGRIKYFVRAFESIGGTLEPGELKRLLEMNVTKEETTLKQSAFVFMKEEYFKRNPFNKSLTTPEETQTSIATHQILSQKEEEIRENEGNNVFPTPEVKPEAETPEVKVETTEYLGEKNLNSPLYTEGLAPRAGFSTIEYENREIIVIDKVTGKQITKNVKVAVNTDKMRIESYEENPTDEIVVDPRPLLHPDNTSYEVGVEVVREEDWSKIRVSTGVIDEVGNRETTTFDKWLEEKEAANPNFRQTKEFYSMVPILLTKEGKYVAYVHDQSWFTPYSIENPNKDTIDLHPADFEQEPLWVAQIQKAADRNYRLREAILIAENPVKTLTYEKNKEGAAGKVGNDSTEVIAQSNPQATLVVQEKADMTSVVSSLGEDFKNGTKRLVNKPEDFITKESVSKIGHTWAIYRVGTEVTPEGKKVETYRAVPVLREKTSEVHTKEAQSFFWAMAIHQTFQGRGIPNSLYSDMSKETATQLAEAFQIAVGIDLTSETQLAAYLQSFNKIKVEFGVEIAKKMAEINKKRIAKGKTPNSATYSLMAYSLFFEEALKNKDTDAISYFMERTDQTTNKKMLLGKEKIGFFTSNGQVDSQVIAYDKYLMQTLHTSRKAYNMSQKGKAPVYGLIVQPILEFQDNFENLSFPEVKALEQANLPVTTAIERAVKEVQKTLEPQVEGPITLSEKTEKDIEKFLSNKIKIDFEEFLQEDEALENIEVFQQMFTKVAGLDTHKATTFISLIVNTLVQGAEFREKLSKESIVELRAVAEKRFKEHTSKMIFQIGDYLDELNAVTELSPKQIAIKKALEVTLKDFTTANENFEELFKEAINEVSFGPDIDMSEYETEDDAMTKNFSKESIEETVKSKATAKLKMLYSGIPEYDSKGEIVYSFGAIPKYLSLDDAYNMVLKILSSKRDPEASFESMIELLGESDNPSVKEIVARLKTADGQLKNQFVVNSAMHALTSRFAMYETDSKGNTSLKFFDTNSSTVSQSIKLNWKNNTYTTEMYDTKGNFNTVFAAEMITRFNELGATFEETDKFALKTWLEDLGIELHPKTWNKLLTEGLPTSSTTIVSLGTMYKPVSKLKTGISLFSKLIEFLEKGIEDKESRGIEGVGMYDDIGGLINNLADIEATYNPELISLVYRDSGKTISTLSPPKYITDLTVKLIKDAGGKQELIEEILETAYSSESIILEVLKKSEEFRDYFKVHHISLTALKQRGEKNRRKDKKANTLDELEYYLLALTAFQDRKTSVFSSTIPTIQGLDIRMANMLVPTLSDKDTVLAMGTVVLDLLKSKTALKRDENGEVQMSTVLKSLLFTQVVKPQLKRIYEFHSEVKSTNVKAYDSAAGLFMDTGKLNTVQVENMNVVEYLKQNSTQMTFEQILKVVEKNLTIAFSEVVKSEADSKLKLFKEKSTSEEEGKKVLVNKMFDTKYFEEAGIESSKIVENFDLATWDFVVNSFLFQAEVNKIYVGDTAQYFKAKFPANKDPYQLTTSEYNSIIKETGINLGKRLALLIAPGRKLAESFKGSYNQIFLKDPVDISENALQLVEWYYPELLEEKTPLIQEYAEKQQELNKLMDQEYSAEELIEKTQVKKQLEDRLKSLRSELQKGMPNIKDYFDIESADAQEYTTVKEHLDILYNYGKLTDEVYQRLTAVYESGKDFSIEDMKKYIFQPIKPVHTGTYTDKQQKLRRTVYIKSSSFPLLPQLTRGKQLDNLREAMEKLEKQTGRNTRASFQSANKVGATKNAVNHLDKESLKQIFLGANAVGIEGDLNSTVLMLNRENFRIQQDTPYKSNKKKEDKVSLGTQIFKLLLGNGVITQKGTPFNFNGKDISGTELYKEFEKSFGTIIENKTKQLYVELGLPETGEITNKETFIVKLQALLEKEAIQRGYDTKSLRGLKMKKYVKNGVPYYDFETPLWLSTDSNKYEALLNSIITNRVMQHKFPGGGFIAGSETGFNFQESTDQVIEKDRIIYLDGFNGKELQATKTVDGKIQKAQVMIESKFKDANGKLINLFEGFNEETGDITEAKYLKRNENGTLGLKEDMIDPSLFNMFSFRTPTSSHVSASSIEIVGILPPGSGDLMIVPKNFTKQKGLDFDIDKESAYALNHYVNRDGQIKIFDAARSEEDINKLAVELEWADVFSDFKVALSKSKKKEEGLLDEIRLLDIFLQKAEVIQERLDAIENPTEENLNQIHQTEQVIINLTEKITERRKSMGMNKMERNFIWKDLDITKRTFLDNFSEKVEREEVASRRRKNEIKLAENDFINVHLAVYNSSSAEIQKKINKVLSMDFADSEAIRLDEAKQRGLKKSAITNLVNEKNINIIEATKIIEAEEDNFSLLTYGYQKAKMDLGAIGKTAIGIYAVATTFNGLIQQKFGDKGFVTTSFTIGNTTSDYLGSVYTIGSEEYTTSEMFEEKENTATDNEKAQILGRVNINDQTISADSFGSLRGFGKDKNGNSILYNLFSQPAVIEYNRRLKESKGLLGSYLDKVSLFQEMLDTLSGGALTYEFNLEAGKMVFYRNGEIDPAVGSAALTEEVMRQGIEDGQVAGINQAEALKAFFELDQEAAAMVPIMSSLNTNTLGKSTIEASIKQDRLKDKLSKSKLLRELIGKQVSLDTPGAIKYIVNTPLGPIEKAILPTTPQGKIAVNGFLAHNKLFRDFFPYENRAFKQVISRILYIKGIEEDFVTAEIVEDIIDEVKKYLNSNPNLGTFQGDPEAKRYELFIDDAQNTSLSTYIAKTLRSKDPKFAKGIAALKNNALVGKKLSYIPGKREKEVSRIAYNNASAEQINDKVLYNALPELILQNLPLPDRENGVPYSTRELVEDLVSYSFLEGGVQEATQFSKYVPVELLSNMGAFTNDRFIPINSRLQQYNSAVKQDTDVFYKAFGFSTDETVEMIPSFVMQYFQNNPMEAKGFYYEDIYHDQKTDTIKLKKQTKFPYIKGIYKKKDKKTGKFKLYYETSPGSGYFINIPTAETNYISQYSFGKKLVTPITSLTRGTILPEKRTIENLQDRFDFSDVTTIKQALLQVKSLTDLDNTTLALADFFTKYLRDQKITLGDKSAAESITGNITINRKTIEDPSKTNQQKVELIYHELVHTLTVNELNKFFKTNEVGEYVLREGVEVPFYVSALLDSYETAVKVIEQKFEKEGKLDVFKETRRLFLERAQSAGDTDMLSQYNAILLKIQKEEGMEFMQMVYATTNIKEFNSVLIQYKSFRDFLNDTPYSSSMTSILKKYISALMDLIYRIFPDIKTNSLAEKALLDLFRFTVVANPIEVKPLETAPTTNKKEKVQETKATQQKGKYPAKQEVSEEISEQFGIDVPTIPKTSSPEDLLEQEGEEGEDFALELDNNVIFAVTDSNVPVTELGLTQQEWDSLTEEEKRKIKECN